MQQQSIHHLRELHQAHTARLRVLQLQLAQLGVNCPAHITVEIEQIQKALADIENQIQGFTSEESAQPPTPLPVSSRSFLRKLNFHIAYGIVACVVIALVVRALFKPSFAA